MKSVFFSFLFLAILFHSCKKDTAETTKPIATSGDLTIQFSYGFDTASLQTDTLKYKNAAGYKMSVSRLQYYVSNFVFIKSDGSSFPISGVYYLDAKDVNFSSILFKGIPNGNYKGLSFLIGLDSTKNMTYYLPATPENNNMEWPTTMGGGYHFMKLEGDFIDSTGTWGYNMHLGSNGYTVGISLNNKPFSINGDVLSIQLKMNVSEWLKNPSNYDFDIDGVFSMGNASAMLKLKNNGNDVFNE